MLDYKPKHLEAQKDKKRIEITTIIIAMMIVCSLFITVIIHEMYNHANKTETNTPTVGAKTTSQTSWTKSGLFLLSHNSMAKTKHCISQNSPIM